MQPTPDDPAGPAGPDPTRSGPGEGGPWPAPTWGLGDVAGTLGATILLGALVASAVHALAPAPSHGAGRAWGTVALLVVPWLALAGWPLLVSVRKGNGPRRDYGLTLTWSTAATGVAGGLCGLVAANAVGLAQQALTHTTLTSAVSTMAASTTSASPAAVVVLAAGAAFGAPVVEELAFRGLTYGALLKRGVGPGASVAAVTVLFALFHFEPTRILVLLVLGAALALVRMWTGSTAASMVAHATVNFSGALAILSLARH